MLLSSEGLEEFGDRIKALDHTLAKLGNAEVTKAEVVSTLASVAKEWLRASPELRNTADGYVPVLDPYDLAMTDVLQSTKGRTRATVYRKKLIVFVEKFLDSIVIAYMRYEGSPSQASARQVEGVFTGAVSAEELAYIQEAARCSSLHCHRAALIMLWAAAMARFHSGILAAGFSAFNAASAAVAAKKGSPYNRFTKGGLTITSLADLQNSRDADVLLVALELWRYDLQVYEEQGRLLGTRNSAAHPGMFSPVALDVRQFAEKTRRYVFDVAK